MSATETTGAIYVPISPRTLALRGLAASRLARGGSIERDARCARERAVNWLALATLLAAWNVEARLDEAPRPGSLAEHAGTSAVAPVNGFDWTRPARTRWTACAAQDSSPRGA